MNNEQVEEIKRHFNAVAEGLEHKIQLVTEGVSNVNEKLECFRQEVQEELKELKVNDQLLITRYNSAPVKW